MVAARLTPSMWSRSRAAGPLRTWVLAALLLALAYTHGVSGESAAGHAHPRASSAVTLAADGTAPAGHTHDHTVPDHGERNADHHDAPSPDHAAHHCVSGQPEQGPALPAPCEAPLTVGERFPRMSVLIATRPDAVAWPPAPPDSTVLRI
ncbi:DUF6153 family protein [Streptomyces sp. NPDC049837]|uniref:DUF6153 family protein n=1 Tax=Streptomyces sp. NPDC049837 TaxID=3155277 RepID=UPI003440A601